MFISWYEFHLLLWTSVSTTVVAILFSPKFWLNYYIRIKYKMHNKHDAARTRVRSKITTGFLSEPIIYIYVYMYNIIIYWFSFRIFFYT